MSNTKAEDFLPSGVTAVAPNGNIFYLSRIAVNKLQFTHLRPVTWTAFRSDGSTAGKYTFNQGVKTLPISNSYFSKALGKPFIEIDSPDGKYTLRAEISKQNFDLSPLDLLPTVEQEKGSAEEKSNSANYAHDLEGKGIFSPERILFSIFGSDWKKKALFAGAAVVGLYIVTRKRK